MLLDFGLELLQAFRESKLQKVVTAHGNVASQAAGKGGRSWLRVGITAQPGAGNHGLGEQQTSCSSFCSDFVLGQLTFTLWKQAHA